MESVEETIYSLSCGDEKGCLLDCLMYYYHVSCVLLELGITRLQMTQAV